MEQIALLVPSPFSSINSVEPVQACVELQQHAPSYILIDQIKAEPSGNGLKELNDGVTLQ